MSLNVYVFLFDEDDKMTLLDTPTRGSDLAGFESFRTTVWGSDAMRALGARFFPVLNGGDLTVRPEQVADFLRECATVEANIEAIAPNTNPHHTYEWYVETVLERLANIRAAAERALEVGGGVVIW
ncbi:MAG: hypothetical protein ABIQ18_22830 [Umezawaea sp.]